VRYVRGTGLVAIALLATLALFGPSTAGATAVCAEEVEVCPEAQTYPEGTEFHLTLENGASASFSVLGIECSASITADVLLGGGNPFYDEVTTWAYSNCKAGNSECTLSTDGTPLTSEIEFSATNPTVVLVKIEEGKKLRVTVECALGVKCAYGAEAMVLDFEGGSPAHWIAKEDELRREEGSTLFCPSATGLSAEYVIAEARVGEETIEAPPVFVTE